MLIILLKFVCMLLFCSLNMLVAVVSLAIGLDVEVGVGRGGCGPGQLLGKSLFCNYWY